MKGPIYISSRVSFTNKHDLLMTVFRTNPSIIDATEAIQAVPIVATPDPFVTPGADASVTKS